MLPKPDVKRSAITLRRTTATGHGCHPSARAAEGTRSAGMYLPQAPCLPGAGTSNLILQQGASKQQQKKPSQAQVGPQGI